ncbi:MAG: glutamine--fructose-6-phosphate transaminase (isomerizing) [Euryarchaeota archaeon]|nr:glutamine--fructose-6-phosphate transaminase (isomerizing) [Euryarchaeota archaeon]|tara:strand:+ start:252 stop:2072 length:1821 start_codon:yes stop_codon:yes gene_type:complete
MCGIFGFIGKRAAAPLLVEGLRRLEYRGYDSSGIVVKNGDLQVYKKVGKVSELSSILPNHIEGYSGIAHTRWATHGEVNDVNAHPHLNDKADIAIVHNGIIDNARDIRKRLEKKGYLLKSETDSETLAHMITIGMDSGQTPIEAVRQTLKRLTGTWGLCVLFKDYEQIICARNGSPLLIGKGDGESFVSSDPHALSHHTQNIFFLEDGDLAIIDRDGVEITRLEGGVSDTSMTVVEDEWEEADISGYPHFMLKEIHEQPEALRRCITGRLDKANGGAKLGGLKLEPVRLRTAPHVRLIGCGTALNACKIGQLAIESLARIPAVAHVASEFRYNDPVINPNAIHFAVSQSGETADTISAVKEIHLKGGEVHGIVNVVGSTIARLCGQGVYIHSGPEQAVASTKAFTNMVASLLLFSIRIGRTRSFSRERGRSLIDNFQNIPSQMEEYLSNPGPIEEAVELVKHAKSVLFLGRGLSAPVASEGALKLMEVAYIPCLAYPAGEMKHGPIALLEKDSPVIVIAPNDKHREKTVSSMHECKARGAKIILIHEDGDPISEEADVAISIPKCDPLLTPLLSVVPTQLIAYQTALELGCDVDRPRNLAKSVTVE